MVHEKAPLQRTIKMILQKYDHIMAKPPRNMAWLGHANLLKTKNRKEKVNKEYDKSKPTTRIK